MWLNPCLLAFPHTLEVEPTSRASTNSSTSALTLSSSVHLWIQSTHGSFQLSRPSRFLALWRASSCHPPLASIADPPTEATTGSLTACWACTFIPQFRWSWSYADNQLHSTRTVTQVAWLCPLRPQACWLNRCFHLSMPRTFLWPSRHQLGILKVNRQHYFSKRALSRSSIARESLPGGPTLALKSIFDKRLWPLTAQLDSLPCHSPPSANWVASGQVSVNSPRSYSYCPISRSLASAMTHQASLYYSSQQSQCESSALRMTF